jgi:HD-like signal output (HDOD) protein
MPSEAELVDKVEQLATLPAVYLRVRAVAEDPRSSTQDLAEVLSSDPALTARLLRVVNSVHFGLMRRVDSVSHAVSILGMLQLHDLVLATSVATVFKGIRPTHMDMARYWRQSVLRALVAQGAAETGQVQPAQRLFLEGLLADIGHLVMYQTVPELAERAMMRAEAEGRPLHDLEMEVVGCYYAKVGARLLEHWQLPQHLIEAIAAQVHPSMTCDDCAAEACILHFARVVVDGMVRKLDDEAIAQQIDPFVWERTRLDPASIGPIRSTAESHLEAVQAMFFPDLRAAA